AAFVGMAAATPGLPTDGVGGGDTGNSAAPSLPDTGSASPNLDNGLTSIDMPKIGGASWQMPAKRHHDHDWGKDFCEHYKGHSSLPGSNGSFQHKCQAKHNSIAHGKAEIAGVPF
ncbi:MAG TPA: hypothetical protein VGH89_42070, partial [Pseudonocardia sp.]